MAVDAGEFRRALETVCDIFKIPSLYSEQEKCLEALFKGKDYMQVFQPGKESPSSSMQLRSSPMSCSRDHVEAAK